MIYIIHNTFDTYDETKSSIVLTPMYNYSGTVFSFDLPQVQSIHKPIGTLYYFEQSYEDIMIKDSIVKRIFAELNGIEYKAGRLPDIFELFKSI